MYHSYFNFSVSPFENNLDQRFLFFSAGHREVIAALLYFIQENQGFALVCGDVGTGKTMLVNTLLNRLPESVQPVLIANPEVRYNDILIYVAGILGIDANGKRVLELIDRVKEALVASCRLGKRFVLIVDEAHLLPPGTLEQIRLLSNIETQEHKLFQILLIGQYQLSHKLSKPGMFQLRQRIRINRFLAPMDEAETIQYIDHRLRVAASNFASCFKPDCAGLIFKITKGVPRSINNLCDSALLICMANKLPKVTRRILKKADHALNSDVIFTPPKRTFIPSGFRNILRLPVAAGLVFFALIGISGYHWLNSVGKAPLQPLMKASEPTVNIPRQALSVSEKMPILSETASYSPAPLAPEPGQPAAPVSEVTQALEKEPHLAENKSYFQEPGTQELSQPGTSVSGVSPEMEQSIEAGSMVSKQLQPDGVDSPSEPPVPGSRILLNREIHFLP